MIRGAPTQGIHLHTLIRSEVLARFWAVRNFMFLGGGVTFAFGDSTKYSQK